MDGAIVRPLPLQEGGIPMWVAGGGEKVTLKIAAQYAQLHELQRRPRGVRRTRASCCAGTATTVGTDFDAIVRSSDFNTIIGATEAEVQSRIDQLEARFAPSMGDRAARREYVAEYRIGNAESLVGTPQQIVDRLERAPRAGARLQHPQLPGVGVGPLGRRAVRARGHAQLR